MIENIFYLLLTVLGLLSISLVGGVIVYVITRWYEKKQKGFHVYLSKENVNKLVDDFIK